MMGAKWKRDSEGDYSLALPTGESAWITKSAVSKNQKPWCGMIFNAGHKSIATLSDWTLHGAKSYAEIALLKAAAARSNPTQEIRRIYDIADTAAPADYSMALAVIRDIAASLMKASPSQ
jgi:hypothetical protein